MDVLSRHQLITTHSSKRAGMAAERDVLLGRCYAEVGSSQQGGPICLGSDISQHSG